MPWRAVIITVVTSAAAIYGVSRAAGVALTAEALTITKIDVRGTNRMAAGEAAALLDGLRGANMVTTDLESWRQKLLEAPWVADAAIRRVFPGTVAVVISEREPLGIGRIASALYLIDQEGTIIDEFGPKYAEFDLPIIDGLAGAGAKQGAPVDPERAALAGRVLMDFQRRPQLGRKVSQVDVSNVRDAVVILKDDTALIHVGDDRFVDRVQAYLDLAPRLHEQVPNIDYVDLRFTDSERVFVGTAGK
jgi:cell division protein FtsQ